MVAPFLNRGLISSRNYSILLAFPSFAPYDLIDTPFNYYKVLWPFKPRVEIDFIKIATEWVFFFLFQPSHVLGVQYRCRVRIIFSRAVKYFLNLFPAKLLHRAFLLHLWADRASVWEEDTSEARCSGLFGEVQAFTSKALILFFAELAQPLPVFGCA